MPFQKHVVAADVIVMPRSCSCSIQSIVAAPSWHLTDLVVHTRVVQDALGGGGLAGIDVRADTDIAVALDGGLAGHDESPNAGAASGLVLTRKGGRQNRLEKT
jgi:hypothetical protein